MALNAGTMATTIVDNLASFNVRLTGAARTRAIQYWTVICQGIIDHLKSDMDVLPASHGTTPLSNDIGQPSSGLDPQGGTVTSTTTAPQTIIGTGSVQ